MGASDPIERDLYQGLIKLAAAYVHAVRGNPLGVRKNLVGARERLADAVPAGRELGLDAAAIVARIDRVLEEPKADLLAAAARPVPIARTS